MADRKKRPDENREGPDTRQTNEQASMEEKRQANQTPPPPQEKNNPPLRDQLQQGRPPIGGVPQQNLPPRTPTPFPGKQVPPAFRIAAAKAAIPHGAPPPRPAPALPPQPIVKPIGPKEIAEANAILTKYKDGKANLETRVVWDELWWELRHWEAIRKNGKDRLSICKCGDELVNKFTNSPKPTSAWLFNTLLNKHADAMDNYPEPIVLPRERSDEEAARVLSSVLPVILESNDYEQTYSDNWWEKLKHGTAAYGVFWNSTKENGLGDVDIREIDLLKLFWEPGITDIQQSRNLFIVDLVDTDLLEEQYPQYKGKLDGSPIDVKRYMYSDNVDTSGKSLVVDWYYKKQTAGGRTVLHYCKYVGNTLLFASENEPEYQERGWYDHGKYPVVLDVLFPEKGTPVGFGYIAVCCDPQLYIDKLSANILENADQATRTRYFISDATGVNEAEFMDSSKPIVHVQGGLDETRIQQIITQPLSNIYLDIMQLKIDEMKDTASNRDVNQGGTSGVTAAAAIAALQEAGNKTSRDMIAASYRAHNQISQLVIELVRQFYDETRTFRITGENGGNYDFVQLNNAALRDQPTGRTMDGTITYRRPIFDLKIKAQKKNPFSRMEQNERAKELYGLGFFNPERAQESQLALDMMEFEGIEKVREKVSEGKTLFNMLQEVSHQLDQAMQIIQSLTGRDVAPDQPQTAAGSGSRQQTTRLPQNSVDSGTNREIMKAQSPQTGYQQRLAKRSSPDMNAGSDAAMPK